MESTVKELINEALFTINVKKEGIGPQVVDGEYNRNLARFKLILAKSRSLSPFNVTRRVDFSQLSQIGFSSIDSLVGLHKGSDGIRYPMDPISLSQYNYLNINTTVGGIPEYFYFEKNGIIKTFPRILSDYEFDITGKLDSLKTLELNDSLDEINEIFYNYLVFSLASRLAIIYTRPWTAKHQSELEDAVFALNINTDEDTTMIVANDNEKLLYRVRNLLHG